jgi:acetyl esterase/lipase
LHVPAREVPVPSSISEGAQAALASSAFSAGAYPALDDPQAWIAKRDAIDELMLGRYQPMLAGLDVEVAEFTVGEARVYAATPRAPKRRGVYLDVHGGALYVGGGACCRALGAHNAALLGVEVWAIDYRMPPEHPYPAPLDDCVAAYRALLQSHAAGEIVIGGASAGSNLAAAAILRARDEGLPLPAATLLMSPEVDLTESGDSFRTNLGVDTVLTGTLMPANLLYAGGHDLAHPYLSPLFGDFSKGFPPAWITAGTRDLFLSNAARMHRALRQADVEAELHVFEATPHGLALGVGTPEDLDFNREMSRFVARHLAKS